MHTKWESAVQWVREQPDMQELVRDSYYDDPVLQAADRYWRSEEWSEIRRLIGERRGRALDAGAGRGIASYALARDGFAVAALEPDPSHLVGCGAIERLKRESGADITVTDSTSETLPFDDETFDLVFARAVLHHVSDLDRALTEFHRVLRRGGLFLAVREHVISRDKDLQPFLDQHPLHRHYGGEHAFRLTDYVRAIRNAGLVLRRVVRPLESSINYAPHRKADVVNEIVRPFRRVPGLAPIIRGALRLPGLGAVLIRLAGFFDHRPGRLYSFVAVRAD